MKLNELIYSSVVSIFLLATQLVAQSPTTSKCGPVVGGATLSVAYECLNDLSFLQTQSLLQQWQYAPDSGNDGITGGQLGGAFELNGLAFLELHDEIVVVVKGELALTGQLSNSALVTHGDLFLNFSGLNFAEASVARQLYGIRYAALNDSGVQALGLYRNVGAKSVASTNAGFSTLQNYENKVISVGGTLSYGPFTAAQTYFAKTISLNVIDQGDFVGPITFLTPSELVALGYDAVQLNGSSVVAFKFTKQLIVDECGVFGGDGATCRDCAGTLCGNAVVDRCGLCGGNGTSCLDCSGEPFGQKVVDRCGVCGGDGTTCGDCNNTENPGRVVDQCGICGGNGTSCLDCKGVPNGGAVIDRCGVCGGNGASCLDCKGVLNGSAVLDRCGVCGGDGKSCLSCDDFEIRDDLFAMDGGALALRNSVWSLVRLIEKSPLSKDAVKTFSRDAKSRADLLYLESWQLAWSIPTVVTACDGPKVCAEVSLASNVNSYRTNVGELKSLGAALIKKGRKANIRTKALNKLSRKIRRDFESAIKATEKVPVSTLVCG